MTPEDIAEMQRHDEEVAKEFRELERERADLTAKNIQLRADLAKLTAERDQAREERDEALKERREETAALDRVRALHSPMGHGDGQVCGTCPDYQGYPCQTIRALDGSGT